MISTKFTAATLALATFAVAHGAQTVRADTAIAVAPLKVINMDVGSKHAVGYYLADNGSCDLTVLLTDISHEDGATSNASRISVDVAAGTTAKVDTIDGTTMAFTCAAGATKMSVRTFTRVALSPFQSRSLETSVSK
jgi:hypothetical protein